MVNVPEHYDVNGAAGTDNDRVQAVPGGKGTGCGAGGGRKGRPMGCGGDRGRGIGINRSVPG